MNWTKDQEIFLRKNYHKKVPLSDLGKSIGKTWKSLQRKAQRMGLSRPNYKFNIRPKQPKKVIDKRYYDKHKKSVYERKNSRRRNLKQEIVNKLGGKCSKCDYDRCLAAIEFHHPGKNKEGNVSTLIKNDSRTKLLKEVKKCIILCANCHRELHSKDP